MLANHSFATWKCQHCQSNLFTASDAEATQATIGGSVRTRPHLKRPAMQYLGMRQASIDYHLEMARRCLALSNLHRPELSNDDALQCEPQVIEQPRQGNRIAAKIIHLQNLIAALTPVPATTEGNQNSVFNRFRSSVETLWNDKREHGARDHMGSQPHLVEVHEDLPMSNRLPEFSSSSTPRHRRAGSSRI